MTLNENISVPNMCWAREHSYGILNYEWKDKRMSAVASRNETSNPSFKSYSTI